MTAQSLKLEGRVAIVTGAARGIGRSIVKKLASEGAQVIANDLDAAPLAEEVDKLAQQGLTVHALPGDITQQATAEALVSTALDRYGNLHIVVNNAGIGIRHPLESTSFEDWQRAWQKTIDTNLLGPANVCFCAARHMIANGGGRIVNITSRGAFRGEPIQPAYGASKAALNSLTQSLALALAPHKIFVGAVAPGFVNTELTADRLNSPEGEEIRAQSPFNRVAEPEEVAHAVLFLASTGAEFSTGTIIDVNGASYLRS